MTARRGFLAACLATFVAPSIVRASSLMPLRALDRAGDLQAMIDRAYYRGDINFTAPVGEYWIAKPLDLKLPVRLERLCITATGPVQYFMTINSDMHLRSPWFLPQRQSVQYFGPTNAGVHFVENCSFLDS